MRLLIISGKEFLQKQIGNPKSVEASIKTYTQTKKEYEIKFFYYDQANEFGVRPVKKNADAIRGFILDVERKWHQIDALILLGGDGIIPFFRLKNPCDDSDKFVFSDSPYASQDDDYLIPERACARIPDNNDANFIIKQFRKSAQFTNRSFGMTAKVWQKASMNVYRQIGNPKELKISPPVTSDDFKSFWLQDKQFLYFNVHGSQISANWYGQDQDEYPIALQPKNVIRASGIVASEACYGAYIMNKSQESALSLKFLNEEEVLCFCGSTTIAYGPAVPPSSEADLLVKYFFEYLKQGLTSGESFKNAKVYFARKVLRRHGFLDDDDQKTLLQFVLYGDPTIKLDLQKRQDKR